MYSHNPPPYYTSFKQYSLKRPLFLSQFQLQNHQHLDFVKRPVASWMMDAYPCSFCLTTSPSFAVSLPFQVSVLIVLWIVASR